MNASANTLAGMLPAAVSGVAAVDGGPSPGKGPGKESPAADEFAALLAGLLAQVGVNRTGTGEIVVSQASDAGFGGMPAVEAAETFAPAPAAIAARLAGTSDAAEISLAAAPGVASTPATAAIAPGQAPGPAQAPGSTQAPGPAQAASSIEAAVSAQTTDSTQAGVSARTTDSTQAGVSARTTEAVQTPGATRATRPRAVSQGAASVQATRTPVEAPAPRAVERPVPRPEATGNGLVDTGTAARASDKATGGGESAPAARPEGNDARTRGIVSQGEYTLHAAPPAEVPTRTRPAEGQIMNQFRELAARIAIRREPGAAGTTPSVPPGTTSGTRSEAEAPLLTAIAAPVRAEDPAPVAGLPGPELKLATPRQLVEDIVARARLVRGPEHTELHVQLVPEHLGRLDLSLVVEEGAVTVRFLATAPEARLALEQNIPHLEQSLAGQGLRLAQCDVGLAQDGFTGRRQFAGEPPRLRTSGDDDSGKLVAEVAAVPGTGTGERVLLRRDGSTFEYLI